MLCIIDYGIGNVGSILNMCKHVGIPAVLSYDKEIIRSSSHLLIPGVGSFDTGITNLRAGNLPGILEEEVLGKSKPVLGVCLGAQIMLESSSEGSERGLGWLKGRCIKFENTTGIKVPHMGWNSLYNIRYDKLFREMPSDPPRFYFVHSYYFNLTEETNIMAKTNYGSEFTSAFRRDNIFGVQFHPEKSHRFGMQLLFNFSQI